MKGNFYEIQGDKAIGHATNGGLFIIDVADLEKAKQYTWRIDFEGYLSSGPYNPITKKQHTEKLHRIIMGLEHNEKKIVDHINRKKHDNRKINLRIADHRTNAINRSLSTKNKSGVTGVFYREKQRSKWVVSVWEYGKNRQKSFKTKEEAIDYRIHLDKTLYEGLKYVGVGQ